MEKEFRLDLRVRNNRLIKAREAEGLSAPKAAAKIGVEYGILNAYEALKTSPCGARTPWKPSALKIAEYYGHNPEYFWPDAVLTVETSRVVRELNADEARRLAAYAPKQLTAPDELIEQLDQKNKVEEVLRELAHKQPRHVEALRLHLLEYTYDEIGEKLGVGPERVRQLVNQCLSKLGHPKYAHQLATALPSNQQDEKVLEDPVAERMRQVAIRLGYYG